MNDDEDVTDPRFRFGIQRQTLAKKQKAKEETSSSSSSESSSDSDDDDDESSADGANQDQGAEDDGVNREEELKQSYEKQYEETLKRNAEAQVRTYDYEDRNKLKIRQMKAKVDAIQRQNPDAEELDDSDDPESARILAERKRQYREAEGELDDDEVEAVEEEEEEEGAEASEEEDDSEDEDLGFVIKFSYKASRKVSVDPTLPLSAALEEFLETLPEKDRGLKYVVKVDGVALSLKKTPEQNGLESGDQVDVFLAKGS
jgi:hypothetical protein